MLQCLKRKTATETNDLRPHPRDRDREEAGAPFAIFSNQSGAAAAGKDKWEGSDATVSEEENGDKDS